MILHRIRLRPRAPWRTPWHADTLYGSLCWELRRLGGHAALADLLDRCRSGNPPFVLSDAFPGDLLPTPLAVQRLVSSAELQPRERFELHREWKRRALVPLETFDAIRSGTLPPPPAGAQDPCQTESRLHVWLDRRTNTSPEGALREEDATWLDPAVQYLSVYARVEPDFAPRLRDLWASLAASGFGKRKSVGMGAFEFVSMERFDAFRDVSGPDGFVSLSHFVPAASDPADGDYGVLVKYGKLGEEFAASENPFKRPLVMLTPGSSFRTGGPPRDWYGRTVAGIAPTHPEVLQVAFALVLPLRFPETRSCRSST